jgi:acetyltransferase-like isoleucine patch superfamily enzyme
MPFLPDIYRFGNRLKNKVFTLLFRQGFSSFGSRSVLSLPFRSGQEHRIAVGTGVFVGPDCWIEVLAPSTNESDPVIVIADEVSISGSCTITAVKRVHIGAGVLIARFVHISDHSHAFSNLDRPVKDQGVTNIAAVDIGEGSWIGHGVVICPGVTIGKNSVIGANSVVNESIPDHCVAVGAPARVIKQMKVDESFRL